MGDVGEVVAVEASAEGAGLQQVFVKFLLLAAGEDELEFCEVIRPAEPR